MGDTVLKVVYVRSKIQTLIPVIKNHSIERLNLTKNLSWIMEEKNPHNYRTVGYCMIMVAASLTIIALLYVSIGSDVLYSDRVGKEKQYEFQQQEQNTEAAQGATQPGKNLSVDLNEKVNMQNKP